MKVLVLNPPSKVMPNVIRDLQYGCWCKGKRIGGATVPPLTLLYVASVLSKSGHQVELLEASAQKISYEEAKGLIKNYDVVITLTSTMTFVEDAEILSDFKKINERLITIIFGSHPSFMPDYSLRRSGIDIVVRHEPEFIIRDVVNALAQSDGSWRDVKGIGYLEDGKVVLNEPYPYIEDLDELPFPDRGLLPKAVEYFNPLIKRAPYTSAITSRGCPAKCVFCVVPPFYGKRIRCRSAENVLEEFELLQGQGYKEVFIRDETFTAFKDRNARICEGMIKGRLDLTWICNTRVNVVDEDMMKLMRRAGCHMIKFGVESGDQAILDKMKKGITVEAIRKAFKGAREAGLKTHAHLMIGNPGETYESINTSIEFVKEIDPTTITVGVCTPYPGTPLFQQVEERYPQVLDATSNDLSRVHVKGFYSEAYCNLKSEELEAQLKRFYRAFYLRPSYVFGWLGRIDSIGELKRVIRAGIKLFQFSLEGEGL